MKLGTAWVSKTIPAFRSPARLERGQRSWCVPSNHVVLGQRLCESTGKGAECAFFFLGFFDCHSIWGL